MDLNVNDVVLLVMHPLLAVVVVFPIIGMAVRAAWQTRQRRLEADAGEKSKIPPAIGQEHLKVGRWLTAAVVGIALLGMTASIFENIFDNQLWTSRPFQVAFIVLLYVATISSLVLLYKARQKLWRGIFATLTGMGLVILGFQDGVFRRDYEWYVSHFYFGIAAALLMIFSLAIVQDIYQDRSNTWRRIHVGLNCVALLLFLAQGFTGTRDLLEIPLSWQEQHIYKCNFDKASPDYKTCPGDTPPAQSQRPAAPSALL